MTKLKRDYIAITTIAIMMAIIIFVAAVVFALVEKI